MKFGPQKGSTVKDSVFCLREDFFSCVDVKVIRLESSVLHLVEFNLRM